MRRATPFVAIAAIFAVQALAVASPVLAFALYMTVVLLAALQVSRIESISAGALAAIAIVIRPLVTGGQAADMAPAVLLAAVVLGVALAVGEVARQSREMADEAQRNAARIAAGEQRVRTILEGAMVGLALTDLDGRWTQVNEQLSLILARSRDDLLQTPLGEITAESDRQALAEAMALLRSGDIVQWEGELDQVRPDGSVVPVAVAIAKPSPDASILVVQEIDISERKRLDVLRDSQVAIRQVIIDSSSWELGLPQLLRSIGSYLDWDVALYWGLDFDRRELRVVRDWHADGASADEFLALSRGLWLGGGSGLVSRVRQSGVVGAEVAPEQSQGSERLEAARRAGLRSTLAFPVIDSGAVIGVVELLSRRPRTFRDDEVTMMATFGVEFGQFIRRSETAQALRRSEADHRAIYERSPIGIARISADGEMLEANAALLGMVEHDFESMQASAWPDLLRTYDQAASRHRAAPMLAGITDGGSVQVRAATASGKWLWLQLTATSIPDASGRPEHVLVMVEDVTTVRETSDKLAEALESQRSANANLERLDRTKTEFLSIVSHEFRTALTGIQGFSELIRDGGLESDEVRAYGGYIFNDADRVNRLIGDMLDLDRMESGRMSMRSGAVDINEVLSEAMAHAGTAASTVEFKADLDPRLPIVLGDRDRLIQVVSNLVNNAIKYSPDGGTVTLSSRAESGYALVSITDTGLGIPADEIGHVFERFRRVRSGAAQSIPGTGLGLTIVKQIVEMHSGKIWVESAVGHGSAFHFSVPLAVEGTSPMQLRHG
ncbi:MAG: ATP-binding protein [Candidatus Dormibacteraceae bacterium]